MLCSFPFMLITTEGVIIQLKCSDISNLGRITSGVKLINLDEGITVATVAKVRRKPAGEDGQDAEGYDELDEVDASNETNNETSSGQALADDSIDRLLEAAENDKDEE